jgi:kynurenine formamidase
VSRFGLSDWANVAEIGAAAGVIVSLIFVGLQLQSNTEATEAATREAVSQKDLEFLSLRMDSSVLARAHAKLENGEAISPLEISQLVHQEYVNFVSFEHSFYQYQKGVLEPEEWLRHRNIVRGQIQHYRYSQIMWEDKHNTFSPGFQELVDGFIADTQQENVNQSGAPQPRETIDLGALVTEDLPERIWGKALLADNNFSETNSFNVIRWEQDLSGGTISGSNSYYTLFNHGGPHVDAANHIGLTGGLDSYAVEAFSGPVKVFDVSNFAVGRTIEAGFFRGKDISPNDIVLLYTNYKPPRDDQSYPEVVTLTRGAALYLSNIPIRAIGTDSQSLYSYQDTRPVGADTLLARAAPNHEAFLSVGIPIYEELFNLDRLLGKEKMFFTGVPLNIENGDGMIVRPVVFVY